MRFFVVLILFLLLNCARPSEDRDSLDNYAGKGDNGLSTVIISGGNGAIRSFSTNSITIWVTAPAITFELDIHSSQAGSWEINFWNDSPLAVLSGTDSSSSIITISSPTRTIQTRSKYNITLAAGKNSFQLAPADSETVETFRFAMFADVQRAIDNVGDIFSRINEETSVRFVLFSGDLTSSGSNEELVEFQKKMEVLNIPLYATPGNHEFGGETETWHNLFGRHNSFFKFKSVYFSLVNSMGATIDPMVYAWLDNWLAAGKNSSHYFFTHFPPLDPVGFRSGSFRSQKEAAKLLTKLGQGNLNAAFYGHIHSFYSYSNAGIPSYIVGGGGAIDEKLDGLKRHFAVVETNPATQNFNVALVRVD